MSQSNTFKFNNYSIVSSLDNSIIYINITDTISFNQYEGNFTSRDTRLNFELDQVYNIITDCFNKESGYECSIAINSTIMNIYFNALIGGKLTLKFVLLLREKEMSDDKQSICKIHSEIYKLKQHCEALEQKLVEKDKEFLSTNNLLHDVIRDLIVYGGLIRNPINTDKYNQILLGGVIEITYIDYSFVSKDIENKTSYRCGDFGTIILLEKELTPKEVSSVIKKMTLNLNATYLDLSDKLLITTTNHFSHWSFKLLESAKMLGCVGEIYDWVTPDKKSQGYKLLTVLNDSYNQKTYPNNIEIIKYW